MTDYKLAPFDPTPEMVSAAEDAYMPFGDMELALRMAILAAPAVQSEPVAWMTDESWRRMQGGGNDSRGTVPVRSKRTSVATIPLYAAPQPVERQPDVALLVEALRMLAVAGNRLNDEAEECTYDDGVAEVASVDFWGDFREALEAADAALAAYRKGGA